MNRRITKILCGTILVLLLFVFVGCVPIKQAIGNNPTPGTLVENYNNKPLTIEEITQKTWEKYFDENKKAKKSMWSYASGGLMVDNLDDITGFEVSIIKGVDTQKDAWYLVEFDSVGFVHGHLYKDYGKTKGCDLSPYPSPFKILKIDPDNRYCLASSYATMRDGIMTEISDEAYIKYGIIEPHANWRPGMKTYDYETHNWVTVY